MRAKSLKGHWAKFNVSSNSVTGYEARFPHPEDWKQKVRDALFAMKHLVPVEWLMKHAVEQGNLIYSGTVAADRWKIYHDGLSQWWEPEAQAYLATLGFKNRQVNAEGDCNVGTRYANKLPGDSPEMCRSLDSHGFADLMRQVKFSVALSSVYPINDTRRFKMGTPKEVWSSLTRAWTIEPTSARIVEDVLALDRVLDVVIAANGCVVKDEFLRTGRRERKAGGVRMLRNKRRKSQRKSTIEQYLVHPDCQEAYDSLLKIGTRRPFQQDTTEGVEDAQVALEDYMAGVENDLEDSIVNRTTGEEGEPIQGELPTFDAVETNNSENNEDNIVESIEHIDVSLIVGCDVSNVVFNIEDVFEHF